MFVFVFNGSATTEIYTYGHTLSLHDALPLSGSRSSVFASRPAQVRRMLTLPTAGNSACAARAARARPTKSTVDFSAGRSKRSEEHTSELQSLMRISYAVFCLKKKLTESDS